MKASPHIAHYYFLGIGGIGMSALARYLKAQGEDVRGYDRAITKLTKTLEQEGIAVSHLDDPDLLSPDLTPQNCLVIYTPAIPSANKLRSHFEEQGFTMEKRASMLARLTRDSICLAVAGTHGKTTTSAILGHLLMDTGMEVSVFLGGISENYDSNFYSSGTRFSVVEADEYDRSFLRLSPDIGCITSMDADHLDIYGQADELTEAFRSFAALVPSTHLLVKKGLPIPGLTIGIEDEQADFAAVNIRVENGSYLFDLKTPDKRIEDLVFHLPGHHNLRNAVTALGMAIIAGSPTHRLPKALQTFAGVERRFSYRIRESDLVVIDDYAHHPTELDALFQAVNEMYPDDRYQIVFQPHLFSRTRDFADGFARSLSRFDEVILMEIYPAREEPIEGVNSSWLMSKMNHQNVRIGCRNELPELVAGSDCRIRLLVGAGDIGEEVAEITNKLSHAI
jgi:UDP-N-acetylmuramate--alanine ligase